MAKLKNEHQELFCQGIFIGKTNTAAAIAAGYSEKTARVQGSKLLTYTNIRQRIAELNEKLENKNIASVAERKEILTEIARGRLSDFLKTSEDGEARVDVDGANANSAALQEVTTRHEATGRGNDKEVSAITKVKLHGPVEAIKELNKMEGEYAPQKIQLEAEVHHNVHVIELPKKDGGKD